MSDEIDKYHLHELMDRLHCMDIMFSELICNHPAADLMRDEMNKLSEALADAYQRSGELNFEDNKD